MFELLRSLFEKERLQTMDAINQLKTVIDELNKKIENHKQDTDVRINDLIRKHEIEKTQIEADIMLQLTALKDATGKL